MNDEECILGAKSLRIIQYQPFVAVCREDMCAVIHRHRVWQVLFANGLHYFVTCVLTVIAFGFSG